MGYGTPNLGLFVKKDSALHITYNFYLYLLKFNSILEDTAEGGNV